MTHQPTEITTGQVVTFTLVFSDPDRRPRTNGGMDNYGDGERIGLPSAIPGCLPPQPGQGQYGPWTPPPPVSGSETVTTRHIYTAPGTYTATFTRLDNQFSCGPRDPFQPMGGEGEATASVTVVVR